MKRDDDEEKEESSSNLTNRVLFTATNGRRLSKGEHVADWGLRLPVEAPRPERDGATV